VRLGVEMHIKGKLFGKRPEGSRVGIRIVGMMGQEPFEKWVETGVSEDSWDKGKVSQT